MSAWYNDIDLFCVGVLRRHIAAGNLPAGEVVNDDIRTVDPAALRGFRQWHLFAGIGGLPYGLRLGGWDDGEEILTAGFPCQPVSMAGKGLAQDDPRWLWPEVERFVRVLRPRVVLLENVPGLLVRGMGDVLGGLAACGYDAGWRVLAAADVGAPHLRQRVWIVAYPQGIRGQVWRRPQESWGGLAGRRAPMADAIGSGRHGRTGTVAQAAGRRQSTDGCDVADATGPRRDGRTGQEQHVQRPPLRAPRLGNGGPLADAANAGNVRRNGCVPENVGATGGGGPHGDGAPTDDGGERRSTEPRLGGDPDGLPTRMDGNTVMPWDDGWEDGVPRLANGVPHRVDRLRALGNAVVPQCVAALVPWIREVST